MKKIMFSDEYGLTDAVLDGRKTMTRRAVQEKYLRIYEDMSRLGQPCYPLEEWLIRKAAAYKVGEVLAVAQSYKDLKLSYIPHIDEPDFKTCTKHAPQWGNPIGMKGWCNKMFVRADLMPYQIRITNIKVERLQDISDEDCLKEGLIKTFWGYCYEYHDRHGRSFKGSDSIRDAFADLIDGISGKGTWERNPFVFVYSFEIVK